MLVYKTPGLALVPGHFPSVIGLCLDANIFYFHSRSRSTYLPLAMAEILLLPFNGQLNLRDAYNWNRNQVSFSLTCA